MYSYFGIAEIKARKAVFTDSEDLNTAATSGSRITVIAVS